jgi:hypothetical protein
VVLPAVVTTPACERVGPLDGAWPPRDPPDFTRLLGALVARYGPRGTLWRGERRLPRRPVRRWQVWNEPDLRAAWSSPEPWATGYVRLLRAAHAAIKGADPRAVVILSGLTNASWLDLREVYRAGGRGLFDVAAVHPFTATVDNVVRIVRLARDEMRAAGDASTPLMVTEMTWTSAGARARPRFGWETDERGQAARLRDALVRLAALRARERLAGAFWYTWMSPRIGSPDTFHYAGLRRLGRDGSPVSKPALAAFRAVVRRLTR